MARIKIIKRVKSTIDHSKLQPMGIKEMNKLAEYLEKLKKKRINNE